MSGGIFTPQVMEKMRQQSTTPASKHWYETLVSVLREGDQAVKYAVEHGASKEMLDLTRQSVSFRATIVYRKWQNTVDPAMLAPIQRYGTRRQAPQPAEQAPTGSDMSPTEKGVDDAMDKHAWTYYKGTTNPDGSKDDIWIPGELGPSMAATDTSGGIVVHTHGDKVKFTYDKGKGSGLGALNAFLDQYTKKSAAKSTKAAPQQQVQAKATASDSVKSLYGAGWKASKSNSDGTSDWTHPQFGTVTLNPDGSLHLANGQRVRPERVELYLTGLQQQQ
jgi:hypothetical protein